MEGGRRTWLSCFIGASPRDCKEMCVCVSILSAPHRTFLLFTNQQMGQLLCSHALKARPPLARLLRGWGPRARAAWSSLCTWLLGSLQYVAAEAPVQMGFTAMKLASYMTGKDLRSAAGKGG